MRTTSGRDLLVGLDVGTTSSKAVVFGTDGGPLATGRAATAWRQVALPGGGTGTELDAAGLAAGARAAVAEALERVPEGRVVGLGVTSMAESGVLLDARGEPAAPVIAWHDQRDLDEVARLADQIGEARFGERTGLPLRSQWTLTKYRWQRDRADVSRATRRLNIAEWVVKALGGDEASDASLASRTGWLDLSARAWWTEALDWSGAPVSLLPPLVTSGTALGRAPGSLGIERLTGAVLTTAGQDHQAAAVGAGAAGPGDQLDSSGTAEALVRTVRAGFPAEGVARLTRDGITVGWHVLDDRWSLLGATQGGLALERVAALFGGGREVVARLDAAALGEPSGDVTVRVDETATVTIADLRDGVTAGDVWRAAVQAITDQIGAVDAQMTSVAGPHRLTVVAGGWSHSAPVMAAKRRLFGDLVRSDVEEAGARGAALLGGLAAGVFDTPASFPTGRDQAG